MGIGEVARELDLAFDALGCQEELGSVFVASEQLYRVALGIITAVSLLDEMRFKNLTYGKYRSAFGLPPSLYPVN